MFNPKRVFSIIFRKNSWLQGKFLSLAGLILHFGSSTLFPISADGSFHLPTPSGSFEVGTRYLYFIDNSRPDTFTKAPDDHRELSIQAWYPAALREGDKAAAFNHKSTAEFWVKFGLFKESFIREVALQSSHSFLEAKVDPSQAPYPVVIYSASGVLDANILLAEELASHGYVVLAVGHPHWCAYYFNEGGEVLFRDAENDEYNHRLWEEENSNVVMQTKEELTAARGRDEKLALQRKLSSNMPLQSNDVRIWAQDISFIIDQLGQMSHSDSLFKGMLDLDRIGVIGYSKGGAAAGQACLMEARCKAGINLSGFMFGDIAEKPLPVPFMVIESVEPWCEECPPINDLLFYTSASSIYMLQIEGATHGNFTDLSAFGDYLTEKSNSILGSIKGKRFLEIQNGFVRQFFDRHLKGLPAPLLKDPSAGFPEVRFKSRDSSP